MVEINLLPTDIAPKSPLNRAVNVIKRIAIYGSFILILFVLGVGAYILFLQSQIRSSINTQQEVEQSIQSLEQTEQSMVLLKDRLRRAGSVLSEDTAIPGLDAFEQFSFGTPASARLTEVQINTESTELSYLVSSSSDLAQLMAGVFSIEEYERIELTSFGFSPSSGYLISLEMK